MNQFAWRWAALLMVAALPVLAQSPKIARVSPDTPEVVREHLRAQGFEVIEAGADDGAMDSDATDETDNGDTNATVTGSSTGLLSQAESKALVERARSMDYERTSQSYYSALEQKRKSGHSPPPAEKFFLSVQLGDWQGVRELLGRLAPSDAQQVYSGLLAGLADKTRGAPDPFTRYRAVGRTQTGTGSENEEEWYIMQQMMQRSYSRSQGDYGTFLEDDFFGVLEAAPDWLNKRDFAALATLGRLSLRDEAARQRLDAQLKSRVNRPGADKVSESGQAAHLLATMGWPDLAEQYLPATPGDAAQAGVEQALIASQLHAVRGAARNDPDELEQAWNLLESAAAQDAKPFVIVERIQTLVPSLPADFVRRELPSLLQRQPALTPLLITALAESSPKDNSDRDEDQESAVEKMAGTLRTQALLMDGLARVGGEDVATPEVFRGLVWNWMAAAETSRAAAEQKLVETQRRTAMAAYGSRFSSSNQRESELPLDAILESAPSEAVLKLLPPGMAGEVACLHFAVELLAFDANRAFESLQLCCRMQGLDANALAGDYLVVWVDDRVNALVEEDPEIARLNRQMQQQGSSRSVQSAATGIPITRAKQIKNIDDFRVLLTELRTMAPKLDPARVAWAFIKLHSGAEVFRLEDLEAVFGTADQMQKPELRALLSAMRVALARDWRDLEVQQKAGTKRTEKEVKDEVSRGYRTALELARRGLGQEGGDWQDATLRAQLYFDAAEFEKDRGITLVDYINLRDAAFASYRSALKSYAAQVPSLEKSAWTIDPFVAWFAVLLGASDLTALMPGRPRDDLGLQGLGAMFAELPGAAASVHRAQFGASLTNWLGMVPPQMKQKLLVAGLQVVGDEPAADGARKALAFYEDLLNEVRLVTTVDGSTSIGHGRPFGLRVGLEHTAQIAREAGGFGRYLMNGSQQMQIMYGGYMPQQRRRPVDHKDNLEQGLHTALDEQFEIRSITFHDPSVQPVPLARDGWQSTPVAYVILSAKDAAVDRIPSIQIDLDFADRGSPVVLTALSPVLPVKASDDSMSTRVCPGLDLVLTLDSRNARTGKVELDVSATANGIIPALEELCDASLAGFESEIKDSGLSVTGMTMQDGESLPQAVRTWQVVYQRKAGAAGTDAFHFPRVKVDTGTNAVSYKHYVDADLETVPPAVALAGIALPGAASGTALRAAGIIALFASVILFGVVWSKRRARRATPGAVLVPRPPVDCTPFTVIAYLNLLAQDFSPKFQPSDDAAIRADIQLIQEAFFKPNGTHGSPDLRAIAQRWLEKASG